MDHQDKKTCFSYGLILPFLFRKVWCWFVDPKDLKNYAMVNFFSYHDIEAKDFYKKQGLTTVIDLRQSEEELWSKMRKKFICKQIKRGEKNGIVVKVSQNFPQFKKVYKIFRQQKDLPKDKIDIYKGRGLLMAAYYKGQMIAGGLFVYNHKNMRALVLSSLHQIKDSRDREIIGQANRMLIWQTIKHAKAKGLETFDLGGINKNDESNSLNIFKESFGGQRQACFYYHKVYSPLLKLWIKLRKY